MMEDLQRKAESILSKTSTWNDLILLGTAIAIAIAAYLLLEPTRRQKSKRLPLPPGPTPWPIVGSLPTLASTSTPFRTLADMADKYGSIMYLRLGSIPTVVVSSASVASEIFKNQDAMFASRPFYTLAKYVGFGENNMIGLGPPGPHFTKMRRIYARHVLSPSKVAETRPVREEEVRSVLRSALRDLRSSGASNGWGPVYVTNKLIAMNANNMTRMIFGRRFFGDDLDDGGQLAEEFRCCARLTTELFASFNLGDYVAWLQSYDLQGIEKQMKSLQIRLGKLVRSFIQEHRDDKGIRTGDAPDKDIIDVLLSLEGEDKVTDEQIMAASLELLLGGSESSAASVEWAMAELINHPSKLRAAQEEVESVVGKDRLIGESDLPNLHYLGCIVRETLRLHPPGTFGIPHATAGETELGGFHIPNKSTVIFNLWKIGREPAFWERPDEFWPERFQGSDVNVFGQNYQLLPFGSGRRRCPGLHMALAMFELTLGALLQSFEWDCSQKVDMTERFGGVTVRSRPLVVKVRSRLAPRVLESL